MEWFRREHQTKSSRVVSILNINHDDAICDGIPLYDHKCIIRFNVDIIQDSPQINLFCTWKIPGELSNGLLPNLLL